MLGLKKKLSALVPADARGTIQKALTVEWDSGHKAVLVDLSQEREREREIEMSSSKGYGRLADEDEEEAMFRSWDDAEVERKTEREKEDRTRRMVAEALGAPRKAESVLGLDNFAVDQDAPPPPPKDRQNPFAAPYRPDDLGALRRPPALIKNWEVMSSEPSPTTSSSRWSGSSTDLSAHPDNPFR
ncbi:hypothetical protein CspHIS471_0610080 [Cutaneotrichosporon sp. HIS471]|nr:hypothetical protein CspHIS471_0610080 [Cutaneotrichosporon sp. HIS471]